MVFGDRCSSYIKTERSLSALALGILPPLCSGSAALGGGDHLLHGGMSRQSIKARVRGKRLSCQTILHLEDGDGALGNTAWHPGP